MKRIILFFVALSTVFCMYGQSDKQENKRKFSPEEFKQKMESFVTQEAELSPQESLKLFPLLHEMFGKQRKLMDQQRELMRKGENSLSEDEYEKIIDTVTSLEIENKKIEKSYYKKFHSILSWKKIHKVRRALFEFNLEALRKFTPHRQEKNRTRPVNRQKTSNSPR